MQDKEVLERVTRIETKLDMLLPHIGDIPGLKNDVKNMKKVVAFIGSAVSAVGVWAATYLGSKK